MEHNSMVTIMTAVDKGSVMLPREFWILRWMLYDYNYLFPELYVQVTGNETEQAPDGADTGQNLVLKKARKQ